MFYVDRCNVLGVIQPWKSDRANMQPWTGTFLRGNVSTSDLSRDWLNDKAIQYTAGNGNPGSVQGMAEKKSRERRSDIA